MTLLWDTVDGNLQRQWQHACIPGSGDDGDAGGWLKPLGDRYGEDDEVLPGTETGGSGDGEHRAGDARESPKRHGAPSGGLYLVSDRDRGNPVYEGALDGHEPRDGPSDDRTGCSGILAGTDACRATDCPTSNALTHCPRRRLNHVEV